MPEEKQTDAVVEMEIDYDQLEDAVLQMPIEDQKKLRDTLNQAIDWDKQAKEIEKNEPAGDEMNPQDLARSFM